MPASTPFGQLLSQLDALAVTEPAAAALAADLREWHQDDRTIRELAFDADALLPPTGTARELWLSFVFSHIETLERVTAYERLFIFDLEKRYFEQAGRTERHQLERKLLLTD